MSVRVRLPLVVSFLALLVLLAAPALALADDATPPVTSDDCDGLWHNSDVTVTLSANDDQSGVASTEYSQDGINYVPGLVILVPALVGDGEHLYYYRSTDGVGNIESPKSCVVRIDTQSPITAVSGDDALWHRKPVVLTFAGEDQLDLSGVAKTQYKIDSRSWVDGTSATAKATANHSWDGVHTVFFRSVDNAGNQEVAKSRKVRIDTKGPACAALTTASAVQNSYATLRYRVSDARSSKAKVVIKVRNARGRTVKSIALGSRFTGRKLSYRLKCSFSPGAYRYAVYATDLAGNKQVKVGVNRLTIRPRLLASISASVSDSTPAQYSDVTVSCKAKDQAGKPLSGVRVKFVWHYKTTTPSESRTTNSSGVAACERYISGATAGYRVVVTVTATYKGVTKTKSTSFTPH
jgi:hypothetical protein